MEERILQFLNMNNISATKLADRIGVQRSSISHILSGRNKPSYDFITRFLKVYTEINAEWLLMGKGDMIKKDNSVKESEKIEHDLFSHTEIKNDIKSKNGKNINKDKEGNGNRLADTDEKPSEDTVRKIKFTNVNKLVRVLLFYEDDTFEEFHPKK